jgi:MFS family permease
MGYGRALASAYGLHELGIVLPIVGGSGAAFASAALFGVTFAGITALTLTLAGSLASGGSAIIVAMLTGAFGCGQVIGPMLGGVIADRGQGFDTALVTASALVLGGGVLMATLAVSREPTLNQPPAPPRRDQANPNDGRGEESPLSPSR